MEEDQEPLEACENCEIQLPASKLPLHEAYCIRNCRKCPKCTQFFSKDVLDIHIEEVHNNNNSNYQQTKQEEQQIKIQEPEIIQQEIEEENQSDQKAQNTDNINDLPELTKQESFKLCSLQDKQSSYRQPESGMLRCSNCKKKVVEDKIDLHETYCIKFNTKCPYCPEYVSKDMLEDHISHSHVKCKYCFRYISNKLVEAHENVCQKGGKRCNFCEVVIPQDKFEEHESFCGSTTAECFHCFKYILKKELKLHDKVCVTKNESLMLPPLIKQQSVVQEKPQEFIQYIKEQIQNLSIVSNISIGQAIYLLDEYGWDFEEAPNYAFQGLPDFTEEQNKKLGVGANLNDCIVCLTPFQNNEFFALNCDHRACNDCYKQWINSQIKNGLKSLNTNCIYEGCPQKVGFVGFEKFLDKSYIEKYWGFIQQSALTSSPKYIMCPNKDCQTILQAKPGEYFNMRKKQFNVYCKYCKQYFCNLCKEDAHKPVPCVTFAKFKLNKSTFIQNAFNREYLKHEARSRVIIKDKERMCNEAQEILQKSELAGSRIEEFFQTYKKAYSSLIESSIIIQYSQVLKIYDAFPTPIIEAWIDIQLKKAKEQMEKTLQAQIFTNTSYGALKDELIETDKWIQQIMSSFQGDNNNNQQSGQQIQNQQVQKNQISPQKQKKNNNNKENEFDDDDYNYDDDDDDYQDDDADQDGMSEQSDQEMELEEEKQQQQSMNKTEEQQKQSEQQQQKGSDNKSQFDNEVDKELERLKKEQEQELYKQQQNFEEEIPQQYNQHSNLNFNPTYEQSTTTINNNNQENQQNNNNNLEEQFENHNSFQPRSEQKCIMCQDKQATVEGVEGKLCDTCFDLCYGG